jgi:hypothetical protein
MVGKKRGHFGNIGTICRGRRLRIEVTNVYNHALLAHSRSLVMLRALQRRELFEEQHSAVDQGGEINGIQD